MLYYLVSLLSVHAIGILRGLANPLVAPWDNMHIKHDWGSVPTNWECLGSPPKGTTIDLRIALKPWREGALIDALYEVSDIGHARYGAYLSREQVAELVEPHPDTLELVNSWLNYHGVSSSSISRTHGGGWLTVSGVSVSQANKLLGASYQLYRHVETNDTILRTVRYALPAALHTHVKTVAPTTYFASMRTMHQPLSSYSGGPEVSPGKAASGEPFNVTVLSRRDSRVTPEVTLPLLRWLYSTEGYVPDTKGNVLAVTGYTPQWPSPDDLSAFMGLYRSDIERGDFSFDIEYVNGAEYYNFDPDNPGFLANLDIQYTRGMAYPAKQIFYSIDGEAPYIPDLNTPINGNVPHLDWLHYMLLKRTMPETIAMSYVNDEQTVPRDYAEEVCLLFGHLGARGVSVLCPSGDHGLSGTGPHCTVNDGSGRLQFIPTFPSSCPYVTSVGGTSSYFPEVAANISGGGFSNYFPLPSYQIARHAVSTYLLYLDRRYAGLYDPTGRGYPDISLQALNYQVVFQGRVIDSVNSTGLASSTAAGLIALVNDYLKRKGRPALGFLNPWLYGRGISSVTDIISGSNPSCNCDGFSAILGWDPVTGLGTLNFQIMVGLLEAQHQQGGRSVV